MCVIKCVRLSLIWEWIKWNIRLSLKRSLSAAACCSPLHYQLTLLSHSHSASAPKQSVFSGWLSSTCTPIVCSNSRKMLPSSRAIASKPGPRLSGDFCQHRCIKVTNGSGYADQHWSTQLFGRMQSQCLGIHQVAALVLDEWTPAESWMGPISKRLHRRIHICLGPRLGSFLSLSNPNFLSAWVGLLIQFSLWLLVA